MSIYYVALDEEKVVGYIGIWHVVTEGHMTNVAIHPDYQNMGIGTLLLEKIIEVCKNKEMLGITLEVSTKNEAAIHLYKKIWFQRRRNQKRIL